MTSSLTRRRRDRGFTLIELMVVVVILGLLVGIVAPSVTKYIRQANIQTAKTQMANIRQEVEHFRLDKRRLPDSLDELVSGEYLPEIPKDPWGGDYRYEKTDKKNFDIVSLGADQQDGGEGEDADIHLKDIGKTEGEE